MVDKNTIPKHWRVSSFFDLLDYYQPTNYIVESTDYDCTYKTPVLTAGKSFIIGYTNEKVGIFNSIPVIIFDDFTTATQFVNFPFKVKSSAMKILKPRDENVNIKFIFYYMQTVHLKSETHKRYWISEYSKLSLPVPPLIEQRQIVLKIEEFFSELDKGKQLLETVKKQMKTYRQAVLKWAFEGQLTRTDFTKLNMSNDWQVLKLKDIVLEKEGLRRGPFGSAIKKDFFVQSGYKVYEQGNAINNDPYRGRYFINEEKYQELKNFNVLPHDLIVSCSGVTLGRVCEIPEDAEPGIINQALLRIRLKKETILNKYFIHYFRTAFFQKMIFDQSQGTAMPNLVGIKDFKEISLIVPKIEEQKEVISEIESRLSICDNIEETVETNLKLSESLRQSILKQAFDGKLI